MSKVCGFQNRRGLAEGNLGLHHVGCIQSEHLRHIVAAHAVLHQRLHGVWRHEGGRGVLIQCELGRDERRCAAFKPNRAWTRRISTFTTSVASNQSAPVTYLLPTPSSTSNCTEFSVTQGVAECSSSASLAEMSEGVRHSKPTGLREE